MKLLNYYREIFIIYIYEYFNLFWTVFFPNIDINYTKKKKRVRNYNQYRQYPLYLLSIITNKYNNHVGVDPSRDWAQLMTNKSTYKRKLKVMQLATSD